MTDVAVILIALLNVVLLLSSEASEQDPSSFSRLCLLLSIPVALVSAGALFLLGGDVAPLVLASLAIVLSMFHALIAMSQS